MTRPPRDALRREILVVARRLFSTIGFRGTSLQMIADAAGCSKAALLYHFESKAAILDELVRGLVEDVERMLAELTALPDADLVPRTLELSVALVVRHREPLAMLRGLDDLAELSALVTQGQEWAEQARAVLAGHKTTVPEQAAAHFFEHGMLGACLALPDAGDEELTSALLQIGARIFGLDPERLSPTTP